MTRITDMLLLQQPEQHALTIKSQGDPSTIRQLTGETEYITKIVMPLSMKTYLYLIET